jgi:hypothetical protein
LEAVPLGLTTCASIASQTRVVRRSLYLVHTRSKFIVAIAPYRGEHRDPQECATTGHQRLALGQTLEVPLDAGRSTKACGERRGAVTSRSMHRTFNDVLRTRSGDDVGVQGQRELAIGQLETLE